MWNLHTNIGDLDRSFKHWWNGSCATWLTKHILLLLICIFGVIDFFHISTNQLFVDFLPVSIQSTPYLPVSSIFHVESTVVEVPSDEKGSFGFTMKGIQDPTAPLLDYPVIEFIEPFGSAHRWVVFTKHFAHFESEIRMPLGDIGTFIFHNFYEGYRYSIFFIQSKTVFLYIVFFILIGFVYLFCA